MRRDLHGLVERFFIALITFIILAVVLIAPGYFFGWLGAVASVLFLLSLSFAMDDF